MSIKLNDRFLNGFVNESEILNMQPFADNAYLVEFLYVKSCLVISFDESGGTLKWIRKYIIYGIDISWRFWDIIYVNDVFWFSFHMVLLTDFTMIYVYFYIDFSTYV